MFSSPHADRSLPLMSLLAQGDPAAPPTPGGLDAATLFYLTLLFIFLTAIVTTFVTRWSKDKCLARFRKYRVTLVRQRGQTVWGSLRVFSSGVEIRYDHPYTDLRGHRKTSHLFYQNEVDSSVLCLCRYRDELAPADRARRDREVRRAFNPGPLKRTWRWIRNLINILRDAVNAAIGTAVNQFARMNPASAVLATQAGSVTQISQALIGRFGNAYEPLLEQYIGRHVILDVADPLNPNNATVQFTGFLADYTQNWIAVFSTEHKTCEEVRLKLPDVERGDAMPPLPGPPPPGGAPPVLPPPMLSEVGMEVRVDGPRFKVLNTRHSAAVILRLERSDIEPLDLDVIVPPRGTFDVPARDARGATLVIRYVETVDILAQRKFAIVRHAGTYIPPRGVIEEIQLDRLPLVPRKMAEVLQQDVSTLIRGDKTDA